MDILWKVTGLDKLYKIVTSKERSKFDDKREDDPFGNNVFAEHSFQDNPRLDSLHMGSDEVKYSMHIRNMMGNMMGAGMGNMMGAGMGVGMGMMMPGMMHQQMNPAMMQGMMPNMWTGMNQNMMQQQRMKPGMQQGMMPPMQQAKMPGMMNQM